jgi:hypothetical protein
MDRLCTICENPITGPKIRLEGVTASSDDPDRPWLWGPLTVHDNCRLDIRSPWEPFIGNGYMLTWEIVDRDAEIPTAVFTAPPDTDDDGWVEEEP